MAKQISLLTDSQRLSNVRHHLEAAVEEMSQIHGPHEEFSQTIVEAANALTILHAVLGELEIRALSAQLADPRFN